MKNIKINRTFTLLEILICLMILGLASSVVGLQIRNMVADHTFRKNLESLFADLRKCQLIATCDQTDIEVVVAKEGKGYVYWIQTDDPLPYFIKKRVKMTGVEQVIEHNQAVQQVVIRFFPSGRFEGRKLDFYQKRGKKQMLDMSCPSIIEFS